MKKDNYLTLINLIKFNIYSNLNFIKDRSMICIQDIMVINRYIEIIKINIIIFCFIVSLTSSASLINLNPHYRYVFIF